MQHMPLVEVTRGSIVESIHYGSITIAQPDGKVIFSIGDTKQPFFLRSAAKPFQALAFLEQGGAERYGLNSQEIAIICSSHSGTDQHVRVLEELQRKIGIQESMLQCGIHAPFHAPTAQEKISKGEAFHPNQHDCAGKHSGMLAYAKMLNAPLTDYLQPEHAVQQSMLSVFAEMCRMDVDDIPLGTDGCSAPVFAVSLPNSAAAYARMCQPDDLAPKRRAACQAIVSAMTSHPDMIAGPQRFDTDTMNAGGGSLVTKIGAEGFHGIGILPGKAAGFSTSLGITIKISEGDLTLRAGCVAALHVLKQLGIFTVDQLETLKGYDRRSIQNWRANDIGEIRPSADLIHALDHLL